MARCGSSVQSLSHNFQGTYCVLSVRRQGVDLNEHSSAPGDLGITQSRGEVDKNPIR